MRFIELFAGIGGFRIGLERSQYAIEKLPRSTAATGNTEGRPLQFRDPRKQRLFDCVWANEIDKYACQIYRKRFGKQTQDSGEDRSREARGRGLRSERSLPDTEGCRRAREGSVNYDESSKLYEGEANGGRRETTHTKPDKSMPRGGNIRGRGDEQPTNGNFDESSKLYEGDIHEVRSESIPDHDLLVGGFPCQSFSIAGKRGGFDDTRGTLFFEISRILRDKRPQCVLLENVRGLLSHQSGKTFQTILKVLTDIGYRIEWQVLNSKDFGVPQNRERVFIIGHLGGTSGRQIFPLKEGDESVGVSGDGKTPNIRALTSSYFKMGNDGSYIKRIASNNVFRRYNQTYDPSGGVESLDTSGGGGHQPCVSHCLDANYHKGINKNNKCTRTIVGEETRIRRLTPTECERLQGFPDGWTKELSDTQRYKCLGNAVTVNVIEAIGRRL